MNELECQQFLNKFNIAREDRLGDDKHYILTLHPEAPKDLSDYLVTGYPEFNGKAAIEYHCKHSSDFVARIRAGEYINVYSHTHINS